MCLSKNWPISSKLSTLWVWNYSKYPFIILLISVASVVTVPLSCLKWLICVLSLFSWLAWLDVLIFYFHWPFAFDFFFSIWRIFALTFILFLPTLYLIYPYFSSFPKVKDTLLILDHLFLIYAFNAMNFTLTLGLSHLTNFESLYFHFHLVTIF